MFLFSAIHIGSQSPRSWLALSEMAREKLVPIAVDTLPQSILKEHQLLISPSDRSDILNKQMVPEMRLRYEINGFVITVVFATARHTAKTLVIHSITTY
jgi:hypothetical protein